MAREALIVGHDIHLAWALPHLLRRAGFTVDAVMTSPLLRLSRFTREVHVVAPGAPLAERALGHIAARGRPYHWVIAADDQTLTEFAVLERRSGTPSDCLPLLENAGRAHLHSKIGLSRALKEAGIPTPAFRVARDRGEAISAAAELGYPVLVKPDASGGGHGIRECRNQAEVAALREPFGGPLLIQKPIAGREVDLSAIFLGGDLVHFSYAAVERVATRFGLSVVRRYYPFCLVPPGAFDELSRLGRALQVHGFANIGAIEAADGSGRFYFEADLRPNAWVDCSVFCGEDAAPRIRAWFDRRARLDRENAASSAIRSPVRIAYFLRLAIWELLANRYGVWRFIPRDDAKLVRRLLVSKLLTDVLAPVRWAVPRSWRAVLRRPLAAASLLPPSS